VERPNADEGTNILVLYVYYNPSTRTVFHIFAHKLKKRAAYFNVFIEQIKLQNILGPASGRLSKDTVYTRPHGHL
jgi:hypothetical protein